jgi:hypothetical protein
MHMIMEGNMSPTGGWHLAANTTFVPQEDSKQLRRDDFAYKTQPRGRRTGAVGRRRGRGRACGRYNPALRPVCAGPAAPGAARNQMNTNAAKQVFTATALVSACAAALLPFAAGLPLGGHGFGTIAAQRLFWESWSVLGRATGNVADPGDRIVKVVWVLSAYATFLLPAAVLRLVLHPGNARTIAAALLVWCAAFVTLFLIVPQATSGP